jgi:alkyl sulfatase BDS1-like metallo-beta-lactamase superfamily hydrolase
MGRRSLYMYGSQLAKSPTGQIGAGLGATASLGTLGLIAPTHEITHTGQEEVLDGVRIQFQMTPGTECPVEMNFYFPERRALCMAENATHNLHNILTLRGAKVRDALAWAQYLQQTIDMFGPDIDVEFASHHWPMWGHDRIIDFLKKQRDVYKYIHDQSVRLMNEGYTGVEISNMIKLPAELDQSRFNRGYYGSVKHNSRAVYQRYMGFYDANPTTLDELPPEEAAVKYVEYMGGAPAIIDKAKADFDKGQYRWVAMALKNVVFADPSNKVGKELLADAYEQMGYQAESGPWRSVYLQGAYELRNGVPSSGGTVTASPDTIRAMSPELLFDYFGVRLNGPKAEGKKIGLNVNFTDLNKKYGLIVENGALNYGSTLIEAPDAALTLSKATLDKIQLNEISVDDAIASGDLKIDGQQQAFRDFLALLDTYPFWFNIVTP